ncbi:hypothetical protein THAOC_12320 [Thalassiosira oceanica]|uniref:RAP domain-containing protein n=1 Tax=Thalassiosira oceanica TaxID=159749 RepID=K0SKF2_THAOC|nr:hypothetical protein THAOC_12320 [Thalassiosira oceanica]|eukprot:EJK66728.1 hypothetical protein THAOC_12320 [Thalassiosira oceanica]
MDQRAGDALRSAGRRRSPAVAADGPSPSEDAATEEADAADGAPSPRPPLRERSPGTANKQSAETTGGAGEDAAAAKRSKRTNPPSRGPKKPKRHRKDGQSAKAKDELYSALDAPQESACGAILASRKDGEDASRRVPDAGGRGRSDAAHARLRDSSVREHGALVHYSSSLDTRQQRQGGKERFEPNGPGPVNREYDDEVGSCHQDRVSGQRRWPRFQPPELGTSRPRRLGAEEEKQERRRRQEAPPRGTRSEVLLARRTGFEVRRQVAVQVAIEVEGPIEIEGPTVGLEQGTRGREVSLGWDQRQLRRSWSGSTRRAFPEESPVVHRSTMPGRNEGRGRGWDRAEGRGHGRGRSGRGRGATSTQGRGPDFRTCKTVSELADLAHCSLDSMSNRDIAAFWSLLPRLARNRGAQDPNLEEKLRCVIGTTCTRMHSFQCRDLAQTSLGIAKTISQVSRGNQQYRADDPRQIIRRLFVKESQCSPIFDSIASSAVGMLNEFEARHLSNLIYSFGLVERNPDIGGETLFNVFGIAAVKILHTFNSQDISNMLWAFVKVDADNSRLFHETGGVISGMDLGNFKPQALSNIIWSFAKSDKADLELFQALGNHIANMGSLDSFDPQALSNTAWAFATAGESHPELFNKIGDHVAGLDSLDSFKPQELSNTAWAFAKAGEAVQEDWKSRSLEQTSLDLFKPQELSNTMWAYAKAEVSHPELLRKIGDHIAGLDSLDSFNPQELSNTIWAYATARVLDLGLFEKLATEVAARNGQFIETQHMSNFLWACATVGYTDERMFSAFAPVIESKLDECNEQDLTNIAWTYSVANAPQDIFNKGYVGALTSKENEFSCEQLAQLHQWQLWQQELESGIELPQSLQEKCRNAFTSRGYSESKLQNDVVGELKAAGLDLDEEVLLGSGYRIDALVKIGDERKVAVEVDGPSHFMQRQPAGSTTLKHRQVARLDRIEVVSVSYWEWDELRNSETKQHYLREKLGWGEKAIK